MNVNTQIDRGMERLLCRREGARLEGLHGLAGLGCTESFSGLSGLLEESGFEGVDDHVNKLKRTHRVMCARLKQALPIAVDAMQLQELGGLGSFFSKLSSKLKKLSPSHALLKKVLPSIAKHAGVKTAPKDPAAAAAKKAAKAAKKQAKADAKAAKKAAKAAAALAAANAQALPPVEAGAAVLANQSGVPLQSPEAQQFAQEVVSSAGQPGSAMPYSSMADAGAPADDDSIFGIPKPIAIGGGVALLIGAAALLRKRRG